MIHLATPARVDSSLTGSALAIRIALCGTYADAPASPLTTARPSPRALSATPGADSQAPLIAASGGRRPLLCRERSLRAWELASRRPRRDCPHQRHQRTRGPAPTPRRRCRAHRRAGRCDDRCCGGGLSPAARDLPGCPVGMSDCRRRRSLRRGHHLRARHRSRSGQRRGSSCTFVAKSLIALPLAATSSPPVPSSTS